MDARQDEIGRMEKQLETWGAKLDALAAKAKAAGADMKAEQRDLVADLKAKQKLARAKLDEVKAAGSDKWETFKAGVESAYDDLEDAFKKLKD